MPDIPNGFAPHDRRSPFTEPFEPLYARRDDTPTQPQFQLGTWLRDVHCNSRGLVHGGFIATLADNAMGLTCGLALARKGRTVLGMVTVNLAIDYVGQAEIGDWLQTDSRVVRLGGTLGFVETRLISGDAPSGSESASEPASIVARANAIFRLKTGPIDEDRT